jgi:hypothetical protein
MSDHTNAHVAPVNGHMTVYLDRPDAHIATLYLIVLWLVFSKLRLVRWGWLPGSNTVGDLQ